MNIRTKILIVLLVVGVVPIVSISVTGIITNTNSLTESIENELITSVETTSRSFISYLVSVIGRIETISKEPIIVDTFNNIYDGNQASEESTVKINEFLKNITNKDNITFLGNVFNDVLLTDVNGIVIFSSNDTYINYNLSDSEYFTSVLDNESSISLDENRLLGYDTNPLLSLHSILSSDGKTIGVSIGVSPFIDLQDSIHGTAHRELLLNASKTPEILGNFSRGEVVRTYTVDEEGRMTIPPEGLTDYGVGKEGTIIDHILPFVKCRDENSSFRGKYVSFDGKEVFGASLCGVSNTIYVSEMPTNIALKPVKDLTTTSIIFLVIVVSIVVLSSMLLSNILTKPITKMTEIIDKVSQGNFNVQIDEEIKQSKNEIGKLAQAFDRTIVSLKLAMKKMREEK